MRIIRPPWLNHGGDKKDAAVYSCDVSPDGKRLATAAGDSHTRIWSIDAILHAADPSYSEPKQLASMSHHLGTIHAVRFSPSGKYLATGADDKYVCIYFHDPNKPSHASTFGTNEPPPVENWRLLRRLPGHDNDVQDLGWSYDSSILVSVGLDSKIVVWSGHTFEKLKTIATHASHVKGVTFDPANKYFATASDDRTIKVFRFTPPAPNSNSSDHVNNFVLEKSISWASQLSPLTTYFRRCSWSPDGNLIAAANSVNGPVSSVAIITRGTWEPGDQSVHLIGHEAPVEVCAFSPQTFSKEPYDPEKSGDSPPAITIIACAGQDKTLTVWSTVDSRPVIVAHDLCEKSFTDLAWHPDGKSLFTTSLDGTITLVKFEGSELGYALPPSLTDQALARFGANRKGVGIVEGPSELLLEEMSKEGEMKNVQDRMAGLMGDKATKEGSSAPSTETLRNGTAETVKGSETPATNGKPSTDIAGAVEATRSDRLKSRITITKDGKKRLAPLLVSSSGASSSNLPQTSLRSATTTAQPLTENTAQTVLDLSKPMDRLPRGGIAAMILGNKRKLMQIEGDEENQVEKRISAAAENGATPLLTNTPEGLSLPRPTKASDPPIIPEYIRPAVINSSLSVSNVRLAVPKLRARILQRFTGEDDTRQDTIPNGQQETEISSTLLFEAQNPTGPSPTGRQIDREPSRILVSKGEMVKWHDYLPRNVLLLAHGQNFWSAACEDGSLHTWSLQGRRLLNAFVLESQPVILEAKNEWLLCITAVGLCYVFNMNTVQSPHPPVSLAPVLDIATQFMTDHPRPAPAVTTARLTSEGRICVSVSSGDTYSYSPFLFVWQRLSEPWWAAGSQYWNSTDTTVGNVSSGSSGQGSAQNTSTGVIAFLERQTSLESANKGRFSFLHRLVKTLLPSREGYENLESSISIAHLENRLAAALQLGAKDDFRTYLSLYVKCLASEVQKGKVEELLADLVRGVAEDPEDVADAADGNINSNNDGGDDEKGAGQNGTRNTMIQGHNRRTPAQSARDLRATSETVCGLSKLELLEMVILILGRQREFARLVRPYSKIAKELKKQQQQQQQQRRQTQRATTTRGDAMAIE